MLAKFSAVLAAARAKGLSIPAIVKYLLAHKADIMAALTMLLEILSADVPAEGTFAAAAPVSVQDLTECGCQGDHAAEVLALVSE
jgi:hypothetical protein